MPSHESRDCPCCSGLVESVLIIGDGAYFGIGAYVRKVLVRTEMGAYIHGVPIFKG